MEEIIMKQYKISIKDQPIVVYEDNTTCIRQMTIGFIKADRAKHIKFSFFSYIHDLVEKGQLEIRKIYTKHNIANILTKALPTYKHKKLVYAAGMKSLHELIPSWRLTFFSLSRFYPIGF